MNELIDTCGLLKTPAHSFDTRAANPYEQDITSAGVAQLLNLLRSQSGKVLNLTCR